MKTPEFFQDLSKKMSELMANSPAADLEKNIKAFLAQAFTKLDLVTREEFDLQAELLTRTRSRLEELEARLAVLERTNS
jgi:BMFP domain-containing protein YqiC